MDQLWEQKWRSFRRSEPQSEPEYSRTAHQNSVRGTEYNEGLLRELTDSEYERVSDIVADVDVDDLSFDNIFQGRKRIVIPFAPGPTGTIGKMKELFEGSGWKILWEEGVVAKEVQTQKGTQTRKIKIGKALTNLIKMKSKWQSLRDERAQLDTKRRELENARKDAAIEAGISWGHDPVEFLDKFPPSPEEEALVDKNEELRIAVSSAADRITKDWQHPHYLPSEIFLESYLKHWNEKGNFYRQNPAAINGDPGKYSLVITRAPIDVLRMSDFDDITSCHSPPNRGSPNGGGYYQCAVAEARGHGPIAYVVENSDFDEDFDWEEDEVFEDSHRGTGYIEPLSRIRLRKFTFTDESGPHELAVPELRTYGKTFPNLLQAVTDYMREVQKDVPQPRSMRELTRHGGSYSDSNDSSLMNNFYGIDTNDSEKRFSGEAYLDNSDEESEEDFEEDPTPEQIAAEWDDECREVERVADREHNLEHAYYSYEIYHEDAVYVLMSGGMRVSFDDSDMVDVLPNWQGLRPITNDILEAVRRILDFGVEDVDLNEYGGDLNVEIMASTGDEDPTPEGYASFIQHNIAGDMDGKYPGVRQAVKAVLVAHGILKPNEMDKFYSQARELEDIGDMFEHFDVDADEDNEITVNLKTDSYIPVDITNVVKAYKGDDTKASKVFFSALDSDGFRHGFWTSLVRLVEKAGKQIELPGLRDDEELEDEVSIRMPFDKLSVTTSGNSPLMKSGRKAHFVDIEMSLDGLEDNEDFVVALKLLQYIDSHFEIVVKLLNKTLIEHIEGVDKAMNLLSQMFEANRLANEILDMLND